MRIIRRGIAPKDYLAEFVCPTCETVVEMVRHEVPVEDGQLYKWTCPVCEGVQYTDPKEVQWKKPKPIQS
jgi:predicted RNA-binding Zn-ribbon protein involved in translation (DUF1610 family)